MRLSTRSLAAAGLALTLAGTGAAISAADPGAPSSGSTYVYSTVVPSGATATVRVVKQGNSRTLTQLSLQGFAPNTTYGAHAHVNSCSPTSGAAAGPHYQYVQGGATDPAFANPQNEIWLDVTTNASGNGVSSSFVEWQFPADRRAKSVIIHALPTATGPTNSGVAGARLACVDVAF